MTLQDGLLVAAVVGTFLCLSWSIGGLIGAIVNNQWTLKYPRMGMVEVARAREASITWLALPAVAYMLSAVTNIGTTALDREGYFSAPGWLILAGGFFALEVVAIVAVAAAGRQRDEWRNLGHWGPLSVEIERQQRMGSAPSVEWMQGAEGQARFLDERTDRSLVLKRTATTILGCPTLKWDSKPKWGTGSLVDADGRRIHVPVRRRLRWLWFGRVPRSFLCVQAVLIILWWIIALQSSGLLTDLGVGVEWAAGGTVVVLATFAAALIGSRGELIFQARLDARDRMLRQKVYDGLQELRRRVEVPQSVVSTSRTWRDVVARLRKGGAA